MVETSQPCLRSMKKTNLPWLFPDHNLRLIKIMKVANLHFKFAFICAEKKNQNIVNSQKHYIITKYCSKLKINSLTFSRPLTRNLELPCPELTLTYQILNSHIPTIFEKHKHFNFCLISSSVFLCCFVLVLFFFFARIIGRTC